MRSPHEGSLVRVPRASGNSTSLSSSSLGPYGHRHSNQQPHPRPRPQPAHVLGQYHARVWVHGSQQHPPRVVLVHTTGSAEAAASVAASAAEAAAAAAAESESAVAAGHEALKPERLHQEQRERPQGKAAAGGGEGLMEAPLAGFRQGGNQRALPGRWQSGVGTASATSCSVFFFFAVFFVPLLPGAPR